MTNPRPVIVVTGSTVKPGMVDQEAEISEKLYEVLEAMPGFVSGKEYAAADGEVISILRFDSDDALAQWRDEGEHGRYQQVTDQYYESFWVEAAEVYRSYEWREGQRHELR
jgi:antibiotic biosynthesis monooxygenase (ABM) superfamily enzyme